MELTNKTALVTGSSRGIGAAIAKTFAANGAFVILHGRDADALEAVSGEIQDAGGRTSIYTADLTNPSQIESMRLKIDA